MAAIVPYLPEISPREEFRRDVQTTKEVAQRVGHRIADDWSSYKHVILTALIAGLVSRYVGRPVAKLENTVIGGIAAGFSALRDPRDTLWKQLLVALGYGATWGLTDVYVPKILNAFSAAAETRVIDEPAAQAAIEGAQETRENGSMGRWGAPHRGLPRWR